MQGLSESQLAQVASLTGVRPARAIAMAGATSSDLYRLDGADSIAVLRLFRPGRWTTSTADLSSRELTILEALVVQRNALVPGSDAHRRANVLRRAVHPPRLPPCERSVGRKRHLGHRGLDQRLHGSGRDRCRALPDARPYGPWDDFGLKGLTTELVRTRLEAFVEGAVSAFTSSPPD